MTPILPNPTVMVNPFSNPFSSMLDKALNFFIFDVYQTMIKMLGELLITFSDPLTYFQDYKDYIFIANYIALCVAILSYKAAIVKNAEAPIGSPFRSAGKLVLEFGATISFILFFPKYIYDNAVYGVSEWIRIVAGTRPIFTTYEALLVVYKNIGFSGSMAIFAMIIFCYFGIKILFASGKRFVDVMIFYLLVIYSAGFFMVNREKFYTSLQELLIALFTPAFQIVLIKWAFVSFVKMDSFIDFFITLAILDAAANIQNILRYAGSRASGNSGNAAVSTIKTALQVIGTVA